eukprot:2442165-Prymnesium_polylepis.1
MHRGFLGSAPKCSGPGRRSCRSVHDTHEPARAGSAIRCAPPNLQGGTRTQPGCCVCAARRASYRRACQSQRWPTWSMKVQSPACVWTRGRRRRHHDAEK